MTDTLMEAIRQHREETMCCRPCADAQACERSTADGRLWAHLDGPHDRPPRPRVDPVVVTCAVRYALGRSSYMPGLIADEVRRCWDDLGDQREVIREDVRRWLHDELPASWMVDRETWEILDRWMAERS